MSSISPNVSVVMCTYNGAQFIDEQVESILKQEYPAFELIIVDDLSTDDTWNKLQAWHKRESKIQVYQNEQNLGYNKNFEKVIMLAKGDLIAISDQDDIWLPQKIGKQVQAMQPKEVLLSHTRSVRLQDGRLRFKSAKQHHHFKGNDTRRLFMFNQVNGHDMMIKKELVEKCLPLPQGMMYDWWIAVMATCYGQIASVNEFLVHHRIHQSNSYFNEKKVVKQQPDLIYFLDQFSTIAAMPAEAAAFLDELRRHIRQHNQHNGQSIDKPFFRFLYENGPLLFGHKKRLIPKLNYYKSARKYARMSFEGRGIL